ncbi:hypothetical protein OSCI_410016 [Kamptonema sp. PCC 6506]|nr:hypothetical protein OSCI_410016 [Kamptonema sp. PCC 6506]
MAGYIEVMLELKLEDPEPELLRAGFKDVMLFNLDLKKIDCLQLDRHSVSGWQKLQVDNNSNSKGS